MDSNHELGYYILDDMTPVKVPFSLKWAAQYDRGDRVVALSELEEGLRVSTVFLGFDHGFWPHQPPLLFETMVFGPGKLFGEYQERYSTWDDAIRGHAEAVDWVYAEVQRLRKIDHPVAEYPPQREGP